MGDKMYDEITLERNIKDNFGFDLDIFQTVVSNFPVSPTLEASLFLTNKKQLFLYISGRSKMLLGDVKKITSRVGLKAASYVPPKGRPYYFDEIGRDKFNEVFPGRKTISDEDIIFYRTLVPYSPALVLISEVKNSYIYRYDSDAATNWRIIAKLNYKNIKLN